MLDVHVREHLRCTLNLLARSGENFLNFHGRVRIPCPTIYEDTEFVVWNQFLPAWNTISNAHVQRERVPASTLTENGRLANVLLRRKATGSRTFDPSPGCAPVTITGMHPATMASKSLRDDMVSPGITRQNIEFIISLAYCWAASSTAYLPLAA